MSRKPIDEVLGELTGSPMPTVPEAQKAAQVARSRNESAADGQANTCSHLSATGVDTTPVSDPAKVWACDHCGLRWTSEPQGRTAESRPRTRSFRGSVDGRDVLVTIHDPEGYAEIAFRDGEGRWGRWGAPSELHEEA